MRARALIGLAASSGAMAVIAGAFGAHGASGRAAEWLRTGGEYQMVHAVAGLVAAWMGARVAGGLLVFGALLFAVTLYAMALGGPLWLGAVTPLGGLAMIGGWIMLAAWAFARHDLSDSETRP